MKTGEHCILLYNPISGHGHLDSWHALFAAFLLDRGYRVLALTPDAHALGERLAQRRRAAHPMLQVLDWKAADRDSLWNKVRRKVRHWRHMLAFFGDLYANERPGSRVTPDMHPLIRSKKRLYQLAVPPVFAVLGPLLGPVSRAPVEEAEHAAAEAEVHYLRPAEMGRRIIAALQRALWQPDFVFNMYMDMFKTGPVAWGRYDSICRLPWGGIRFVPSAPPYEAYYASPSFRGMCFLDEAACEDYSRRYPGKQFPAPSRSVTAASRCTAPLRMSL